MIVKFLPAILCALSAATIYNVRTARAFEFDQQCLALRQLLVEAAGTPEQVAEETETDPRLFKDLLSNEKYVCTDADKAYLKRQVLKDGAIVGTLERIVANCPQYIDPEPIRQKLTGDDAKPDSETNQILDGFSETKRFLSFAKEAQKLHIRGATICDGEKK